MNFYQRVFGSGPLGLILSIVLLLLFARLDSWLQPQPMIDHAVIRMGMFALFSAMTLAVLMGAVRALPPTQRGETLVNNGIFRFFRHPLYAAFLTFFNFGLAVVLNSWVYLVWATILHPVWHWVVDYEEALMRIQFPEEYDEYCARTGRFVPRVFGR